MLEIDVNLKVMLCVHEWWWNLSVNCIEKDLWLESLIVVVTVRVWFGKKCEVCIIMVVLLGKKFGEFMLLANGYWELFGDIHEKSLEKKKVFDLKLESAEFY